MTPPRMTNSVAGISPATFKSPPPGSMSCHSTDVLPAEEGFYADAGAGFAVPSTNYPGQRAPTTLKPKLSKTWCGQLTPM